MGDRVEEMSDYDEVFEANEDEGGVEEVDERVENVNADVEGNDPADLDLFNYTLKSVNGDVIAERIRNCPVPANYIRVPVPSITKTISTTQFDHNMT
jgi:hypothetical protein